jgi:peptidoglycan/xylan/chitin deacetylase (PgdA/CDA1 family)
VTLEEAISYIDGTTKDHARRCRVLITFDDGYLDNYKVAYPILRSHGLQGVFFLATGMVGSCQIPWWDHIAYLVRTSQRQAFSLHYPSDLDVNLDQNGLAASLNVILKLYKRPDNADPARFIRELEESTKGEALPQALRRFLDWDEAREMVGGGMAIGSHTHSHQVLSQLEPQQQYEELSNSRTILKEQLGTAADALAYPVGARTSFTSQTQQAARDAGYRIAFSFFGGINLRGQTRPHDVRRIGIDNQSGSRFRVQLSVCRSTGNYWP